MADNFLAKARREKEWLMKRKLALHPLAEVVSRAAAAPGPRPFKPALGGPGTAIIGEVKRRSPSAGVIREMEDPADVARAMARGGVAAVSVLTEETWFGGSLDDLSRVKGAVALPVLRKDFIIHPYELFEARAHGADAVLLITALLGRPHLGSMLAETRGLGMDGLVEVHDEAELELALSAGADLVGINNRDLETLTVDLGVALRLAPKLPAGVTGVGESGYRTPEEIREGRRAGLAAFLIGEALMRSGDVADAVRRLVAVPGVADGEGGRS